jgi:hypothetical protein
MVIGGGIDPLKRPVQADSSQNDRGPRLLGRGSGDEMRRRLASLIPAATAVISPPAAATSILRSPRPCVRRTPPELLLSPARDPLKESSVRASSAATSSNSAGEIFSSRCASSKPSGVLPGFVAAYCWGPPATLQTHRVRMNLRPGSRPRLLPFPEGGVLRVLADDRVVHDCVAEVVNHCCDGECATEPFVQTRFRHLCLLDGS